MKPDSALIDEGHRTVLYNCTVQQDPEPKGAELQGGFSTPRLELSRSGRKLEGRKRGKSAVIASKTGKAKMLGVKTQLTTRRKLAWLRVTEVTLRQRQAANGKVPTSTLGYHIAFLFSI